MSKCLYSLRTAALAGLLSSCLVSTAAAAPTGGPIQPPFNPSVFGEAVWTAENNLEFSYFGFSVSSAGDVNGDGYSDVVVGTMPVPGASSGRGAIYLYYGSPSGLSPEANWMHETQFVRSFLAYGLFCAGDVNGDGYDDMLVNEPRVYSDEVDESRVFVFYGSSTGPSTSATWTVSREASPAGDSFGWSLAPAGDVNGDGFDDILIASRGATPQPGEVELFYGSAEGLSTTAGWSVKGQSEMSFFGGSVEGVGDVNGDGYGDVLISDPSYNNGAGTEGRVFLYCGSAEGLSTTASWSVIGDEIEALLGEDLAHAGDVNGDGYDDVLLRLSNYDAQGQGNMYMYLYCGSAEGLSTTASWSSRSTHPRMAMAFVNPAGDVNNDGYDDVLIGGRWYANGEPTLLLYQGSAAGLTGISEAMPAVQDSSSLGRSFAAAGDVNGDGLDDVIVGLPLYDNDETNEGRALLFSGIPPVTHVGEPVTTSFTASVAGSVVENGEPLLLDLFSHDTRSLRLHVYDLRGTLLLHTAVAPASGTRRIGLALPGLSTGRYFVRLVADNGETLVLPFGVAGR